MRCASCEVDRRADRLGWTFRIGAVIRCVASGASGTRRTAAEAQRIIQNVSERFRSDSGETSERHFG